MLEFTARVECPECETEFEAVWLDDSITAEDMTEPPEGDFTCPGCGHIHHQVYPGWMFRSEAG